MEEWKIHFGSFTDFTYDLSNGDKEVEPSPSSIPESVLKIAGLIYENNEQDEMNSLQKEKKEKQAMKKAKNQRFEKSTSSKISARKQLDFDNNDDDSYSSDSSSSSSADFEIEILQKKKKKVHKVEMNHVIYSFSKPEPEVRRMFVTSRAPRSQYNDRTPLKKERVQLAARLSSRRKIPVSSMVHQHELMLLDISDLEKK